MLKKIRKATIFLKSLKAEPLEAPALICASSAIIFLFLMLIFIVREGGQAFLNLGAELIIGAVWDTSADRYGGLPLIYGSIIVVSVALAIAIPIGVSASIFISEILPRSLRDPVKSIIELLASIPSVIYGFIGLLFIAPRIAAFFGLSTGTVALTASIVLAIMSTPTIVGVAGETIAAVPLEYKEAALALGATKWQMIKGIVLPASKSGILASILLGFGRAIGETVAVLMVAGNTAVIPSPPWNILSPVYTLTAAIAIQMGEAAIGSLEYSALFGLGLILFIIAFTVNTLADIVVTREKAKIKGAG